MKFSEFVSDFEESFNKINDIVQDYKLIKGKISDLNEVISQQEKTGNVFFRINFVLNLDPVIERRDNAHCKDVDILTPLMEYYKKELEKIKQELKKYGVEFDV